ncbi:MAG: hypothetical protein HYU87_09905 [Chloroflexi bacterium]|nr:hypothetical protein [Chloroflexota bacterium]
MLTAARAWERLRLSGVVLARREAAAAHGARAALGRAIRDARERRARGGDAAPSPVVASVASIATSSGAASRWRVRTAAFTVLAASLVLVVLAPVGGGRDLATGAAAEPDTPRALAAMVASRGRTAATLPPAVAAATAAPEPQPTAKPEPSVPPAATASPAPSAGASAAASASPSGTPATAGASAGAAGAVPGAAGGTGSAIASPTPKLNVMPVQPPLLPSGSDRFLFQVLDQRTGMPLANVCVIYGTLQCGEGDPHTNLLGYYWLDFPVRVAANWSFHFSRGGYVTATVNKTYRADQGTVITTIALRRR